VTLVWKAQSSCCDFERHSSCRYLTTISSTTQRLQCLMLLVGGRKGIWPVKIWVVGCWHAYLSGASLSLASVKSRLVLPFWYQLTWVVPEKGLLNVCSVVVLAEQAFVVLRANVLFSVVLDCNCPDYPWFTSYQHCLFFFMWNICWILQRTTLLC